jgi:hypothetical protein
MQSLILIKAKAALTNGLRTLTSSKSTSRASHLRCHQSVHPTSIKRSSYCTMNVDGSSQSRSSSALGFGRSSLYESSFARTNQISRHIGTMRNRNGMITNFISRIKRTLTQFLSFSLLGCSDDYSYRSAGSPETNSESIAFRSPWRSRPEAAHWRSSDRYWRDAGGWPRMR